MATKFDIKSLTDATPLYAAVGAADTVYTTVRDRALSAYADSTARVQTLRAELKPSAVQAKVVKGFADMRDQVEALPSTATERIDAASIEAGDQYTAYAKRGEKVVKSLRKQVDGLEASAKKQVTDVQTTARKAAADAQTAAVSTLAASRKDAAKVVAGVAGKVEDEARAQVRSAAAKEGAAKRPARKTVAKKATARKAPARKTVTSKATAKKAPAQTTAAKTSAAKTEAPKTNA